MERQAEHLELLHGSYFFRNLHQKWSVVPSPQAQARICQIHTLDIKLQLKGRRQQPDSAERMTPDTAVLGDNSSRLWTNKIYWTEL